jgi:RNA polymerase sigma factor (sigma-70 family)
MAKRLLPPFQFLVDDHGVSVWRFCRAMLGAHDGDDCYQETMVAALRAYPDLRDDQNLRGWLFTIAHRKAIDWHRRTKRRGEVSIDGHEPRVGRSGSSRRADDVDPVADAALWTAVGELPPKQRAAVVHRFIGDLAYIDIAAALDCSEAAARQNVRAGLRALRASLGESQVLEVAP